MRSMPLVLGFLLGLAAAAFTGCPTSTCSPANCALGCCDASGRCQTSSSSTCGTKGSICSTCRIDESCVSGSCMSSSSGAGPAGGGTSGTGGGTSGTGTYAAFLDGFSNGYCAKVIECGQLPNGSASECFAVFRPYVARSAGSFGGLATERGVRIGASTFDAAKAQTCLAQLASTTCSGSSPQGNTSACSEVTRPAAGLNAACDSNADCSDPTTSCNGQPCMRRCTTGGGLGEACRAGMACDAPNVCINGRCAAEPAPGTPCSSFSSSCGPNGQCRNGVCERLPTVGQPCPNFVCVASAYCDAQRVCRDKKPIGQTCALSSDCTSDAFCRSSVCTARGTPGASCRMDSECADGTSCFEGSCRTRGAMGARCIRSQDCTSTLSCDEVLRTCQSYVSNVTTGQPCTNSTQRCQSSSEQCRNVVVNADGGVGTRGTCGTPVVGDPCPFGYECATAQYCESVAKTCQAAGPSTPCSSDNNCRSTDFCSYAGNTRTCAPKIATGQPCTESSSCAAQGDRCQLGADGGVGRCGPTPTLGQPCTSACAFPNACSNGVCVMAGHVGEICSPNTGTGCINGACQGPDGGIGTVVTGGRCVGPQPNGTRCESDVGCQSGHCDRVGNSTCVAACN